LTGFLGSAIVVTPPQQRARNALLIHCSFCLPALALVVVACRSDNVSPTVTEPPLINVLTPGQAPGASSNNIVRHNESFANDFGIQVNASLNNVVFENETHDNRNTGMRN